MPMRQIFLSLSIFLLLLAHEAKACGCDSTETFEAAVERANVVFTGTCLDASPNSIKGGLNIVFQVDSSWKRRIEAFTTVHSNSSGQCGFLFKPGLKYLVVATKRHQTIATSICEPNQVLGSDNSALLAKLGQGYAPGRPELARSMNILILVLGLLGLAFVAFVVLKKRKQA